MSVQETMAELEWLIFHRYERTQSIRDWHRYLEGVYGTRADLRLHKSSDVGWEALVYSQQKIVYYVQGHDLAKVLADVAQECLRRGSELSDYLYKEYKNEREDSSGV